MTRLPKTVCQCLAICLPFCQTLADTVAGRADAPGQTQKVAVVEGPVILRAAANAAVLDAYKGAAGELVWSAESPCDWRLHAGDGKTGGWSVFRDYVLPLWENRWISWGDNVADATGELRMHGHPVALSAGWKVRANGVLAISYGTNAVAWFGSANAGGRILDYAVATNGEHRVTCVAIEGEAAQPRLQTTTALAEAVWADAEGVTTNRIDASTVELVATPAAGNAFFRVVWSDGLADGLTVRGAVTADGFTCGGTTVTNFGDLATTVELADAVAPLATKAALVAVSNAQTNYLPLAGGTLTGNLAITNAGLAVEGSYLYRNVLATNGSLAVGRGSQAISPGSLAVGSGCIAGGTYGSWNMALGEDCQAPSFGAFALGRGARGNRQRAFVWSATSGLYNAKAEGAFCISPQGGITNAWIGETNLADHISAAVAPVESRVDELEEQAGTCCLYWDAAYVSAHWDAATSTINIPTNFPTRRLNLWVSDEDIEALTLNLPAWAPDRNVEIELHPIRTQNTTRSTKIAIGGVPAWEAVPFTAYNNWRYVLLSYDPITATWQADAPATFRRATCFAGGQRLDVPTHWPATVEEWEELRNGGTRPLSAPAASLSHSLSPAVVPALDFEPLADPSDEASE